MIHIYDKQMCAGCYACVQRCPVSCITMQQDSEGFPYPVVDETLCIKCGLCDKVCPVLRQAEPIKPLYVYAAKNKDEEVRRKSSSGGIFFLLAREVLMDNGVVFGARFNEGWEVVHDYTETLDGLSAFCGSKYVQSRIEDNYIKAERFLKKGRRVLFSGTPCQIAGLNLYLGKKYNHLLTIDVVCHGTPSVVVWRKYLMELFQSKGKNINDICYIDFRDKSTGWKNYSITFRGENEILFTEPARKNIFMQGFLANLYLRPSCHVCPTKSFKSGSDVTLGDFWGVQNVFTGYDDDKGVSAVMVKTEKGRIMLEKCCRDILKETNYNVVLARNLSIEKSASTSEKRQLFFVGLREESVIPLIKHFTRLSWHIRLKKVVKRICKFTLRQVGIFHR